MRAFLYSMTYHAHPSKGFFTFQTTSGFTAHEKMLSAFTLTRKARNSMHQFLQNRKKWSYTKFHQNWTMNVKNTDRISSSTQSQVKCHCHQNDLHETCVWPATFLKDSCTELHENPTYVLVGNTRIQTDWRMDMVST